MAPYDNMYSSWKVPYLTEPEIGTMMDILRNPPRLTPYSEIYRDVNTGQVKTKEQEYEINQLKKSLEAKEIKKQQDIKNLIAYYYYRK